MSFRSGVAVIALGVFAVCGQVLGGEVTLRVVDREGRAEECWVRVFRSMLGDRDYASTFHGLKASGVDPGTYNFELVKGASPPEVPEKPLSKWLRAWGEVTVGGPASLFVIVAEWTNAGIAISAPFALPALEGTIEPHSRLVEGSNWIRFNAVYGTTQFDVDVDASGGFRVWKNLDGIFLLTVISGSDILGTQMVSFRVRRDPMGRRQPTRMVLNLTSRPVDMMRVEQAEK